MSQVSPHPHWQRTVQVVALMQVAILIGFNLAYPFIPLFVEQLGVHDQAGVALWTGLSVGLSGIVMAIASPLWGMLADRVGRKAMLVRSVGAGSIVLAAQAAVTNVWELVAVRMVQGALTGTQTASAMLLAGIVPRDRTGFALGLLNTSIQVGNLVGPVVGGFVVVAIGLRSSFLAGGALLAICTIATIVAVEDAPVIRSEPIPSGVRGGLRDLASPFAWPGLRGVLVAGALIQVAYSGTVALVAIYIQDLVRPDWLSIEVATGLSLALAALAAAVTMPFFGSYADRHDPRSVLVISLAIFAAGLVPQAVVPSAVVFLAFRLAVGVGLAGTTSAIAVLTRAGAPAGGEGRAFGTLSAAQNLGWGLGPILGSALAAVLGIPALYLAGAALLLGLVGLCWALPGWFESQEPVAAEPLTALAEPADLRS